MKDNKHPLYKIQYLVIIKAPHCFHHFNNNVKKTKRNILQTYKSHLHDKKNLSKFFVFYVYIFSYVPLAFFKKYSTKNNEIQ